MARKQKELPGLEKQVENPQIEEAAEAFCKMRNERDALTKKTTLAMLTLLATLKTHKVEEYEYVDDFGEVLVARIKLGKEVAVVEKTGEAESEIGEGVDDEESILDTAKRQAAKSQADSNVAEDDDGDVVVPDKAAPKTKRKGKKKPADMHGVH